jgi:hypothetical protein
MAPQPSHRDWIWFAAQHAITNRHTATAKAAAGLKASAGPPPVAC